MDHAHEDTFKWLQIHAIVNIINYERLVYCQQKSIRKIKSSMSLIWNKNFQILFSQLMRYRQSVTGISDLFFFNFLCSMFGSTWLFPTKAMWHDTACVNSGLRQLQANLFHQQPVFLPMRNTEVLCSRYSSYQTNERDIWTA